MFELARSQHLHPPSRLDKPEVPLIISSLKFAINIVLGLFVISWFHIESHQPDVNDLPRIRLACDLTAAIIGMMYFLWTNTLRAHKEYHDVTRQRPSSKALRVPIRPGILFFTESAVRNALYLWLVSVIVAMGDDHAIAWGVFNTMRWGLVMMPVQRLEASSSAFVGHAWGNWRKLVGTDVVRPHASRADVKCRSSLPKIALTLIILFYL